MIVILLTIAVVLSVYLLGSLLYLWKGIGKRLYHDVMKWHMPIEGMFFDGCSWHSKCKYCGKEIMQDSQGDWF